MIARPAAVHNALHQILKLQHNDRKSKRYAVKVWIAENPQKNPKDPDPQESV